MVRDEFLGAAGASGGGGGGSGGVPSYPSAAFVLLGLQPQPNSSYNTIGPGLFRYSTSGLGSKFVFPIGYGTSGSTTNPDFTGGIPRLVFSPQQNCVIGFSIGSTTKTFSATFNSTVGTSTPFGTYYNNMPNFGLINAVVINNSSSVVIVGAGSTLYARSFNASSGWGAALNAPAEMPTGTIKQIKFAAGESIVLVSTDTAPYLHVYQWNGSGFGSKLAGPPVSLPVSTYTGNGYFQVSASGNILGFIAASVASPNSTTPAVIYFYNVNSSGITYKSTFTLYDSEQQINVTISMFQFAATGNSLVMLGTPNVYSFLWTDTNGIGNRTSKINSGAINPLNVTLSSNAAYAVTVPTTGMSGFVPTRYEFQIRNYVDSTGVGSIIGTTQVSDVNTVTFLGGAYFT